MTAAVDAREVIDLLAAWVVLGLAFAFVVGGPPTAGAALLPVFALTFATAGVGVLLHELAHKVVALHFGADAAFRADYGMLFFALMSGLAGFLFAAPGAVHYRGRVTERANGLIAVAGPVTNLALAGVFGVVTLLVTEGALATLGGFGVAINLLLAGFNMLPIGPLDGRKVLAWSRVAFVAVAAPSVGLALAALTGALGSVGL